MLSRIFREFSQTAHPAPDRTQENAEEELASAAQNILENGLVEARSYKSSRVGAKGAGTPAGELLDEEALSYVEVAGRCGFTSVQAMSKYLDRWTKRTAYEYRVGKSNGHRTSHKQDIRSDKQEWTSCK